MQRCYNDGIDFEQAEQTLFPYTHEEVGALVIKKWNFPDHLMKAVMAHHSLALAEDEDPYLVRLTCVVSLSNIFCHRYGIGTISGEEEIDVAATVQATTLGLTAEKVDELLFNFKEAYDKDQSFFT